ncbi:redoxin domain-containing protein [Octadecabacter sp. 1_MG-2023]|uniref:redoxin domain-containing protein n=1 Tax=unclassified Octadecabacter TaxID=196158 RepID=UPI001C09AEB0|nr:MULTISPECIES: redoxin domain-containing protein [unclassified Octadecabacter]MBU2993043.1 redoxin domain-containing protein [Octadecabacter sp. B2R22]MDO6733505.1 redoxin domain-containing protein [Octadecabacter sp. 1_MG-2023]
MPTPKPVAGSILAPMSFPKLGGGELSVGGKNDKWTLFIVYRGKHCGRCKKYLKILNDMRGDWADAGFDVAVVSADTEAKAQADVAEFGWEFDLGYGLTEEQMGVLGVYVSDPLSPTETDRRFAEPGVFVLRPDGSILLISISNGPSARPDLVELLDGMIFTIENDRPPRGTA